MVILPDESEANSESTANNAALIAAANEEFIASSTVLILNAISNGFFEVQPPVMPLVDIPTVTTYFQNAGYTVLFPVIPTYPYQPPGVLLPEAIPPGYIPPNSIPYVPGPPRMKISWTT